MLSATPATALPSSLSLNHKHSYPRAHTLTRKHTCKQSHLLAHTFTLTLTPSNLLYLLLTGSFSSPSGRVRPAPTGLLTASPVVLVLEFSQTNLAVSLYFFKMLKVSDHPQDQMQILLLDAHTRASSQLSPTLLSVSYLLSFNKSSLNTDYVASRWAKHWCK